MDIKTAKAAIAAVKQQKAELEDLLAGVCGKPGTAIAIEGCSDYAEDPFIALIGKSVYIRQATYHLVGKLALVGHGELVLDGASTVFDTGDLGAFLKSGKASAIEPMGRVIVARGAIVDCCECKLV